MGGGPDVQVVAYPGKKVLLTGVNNELMVLFEVVTPKQQPSQEETEPPKVPLNVCILLDVSGSMASENKLAWAKEAIIDVLEQITDGDIFHLVTYSTNATIVLENVNGKVALQATERVEQLKATDFTNIESGLRTAASVIEKHQKPGYSNKIFLFSDGLANEGEFRTAPKLGSLAGEIASRGISTTSFGIGADFDEAVMKAIATQGGSTFYLLDNAEAIKPIVACALSDAKNIAISNATLTTQGLNGTIVEKMYNHKDLIKGARLGDLRTDSKRQVLVQLSVPGLPPQHCAILKYELKYCLPQDLNVELSLSGIIEVDFVDDNNNPELVKEEPKVRVAHLIQQSSHYDKKVSKFMAANSHAEALHAQAQGQKLLEEAVALEGDGGFATELLKISKAMLESLQRTGITERSRKTTSHMHYMKATSTMSYTKSYSSSIQSLYKDTTTAPPPRVRFNTNSTAPASTPAPALSAPLPAPRRFSTTTTKSSTGAAIPNMNEPRIIPFPGLAASTPSDSSVSSADSTPSKSSVASNPSVSSVDSTPSDSLPELSQASSTVAPAQSNPDDPVVNATQIDTVDAPVAPAAQPEPTNQSSNEEPSQ